VGMRSVFRNASRLRRCALTFGRGISGAGMRLSFGSMRSSGNPYGKRERVGRMKTICREDVNGGIFPFLC